MKVFCAGKFTAGILAQVTREKTCCINVFLWHFIGLADLPLGPSYAMGSQYNLMLLCMLLMHLQQLISVYWRDVTPVWKSILWLKWSFILSFTLCVAFLLAGPEAEILQPFFALALFAFFASSLLACNIGCGLHSPGPGSCWCLA